MKIAYHILRNVLFLTDVYTKSNYPKLNRGLRKESEALRLQGIPSALAQSIKCVDILDNANGIAGLDVDFAATYLREKLDVINILTKVDSNLINQVKKILTEEQLKLKL